MNDLIAPVVLQHPALAASSPAGLVQLQAQLFQEMRAVPRPLAGLMTWLLDRRNLEGAWERVCSADGADTPGPDGLTCAAVRDRVGSWLAQLAEDIYHRRYRGQPPRIVDVPKPNKPGAFRRLGILNLRDRLVHAALKQLLEPLLEPVFLPSSFGFRPGRSVPGALSEAVRLLEGSGGEASPFTHGAHLDVADCFDTIDHNALAAELRRHLADSDLLALLEQVWQPCGTTTGRLWWQRRCGLTQGSALSPLLCNLYLHGLDQALAELGQATGQGICALRYADDVLILGRDARLVERAVGRTRQVLRQFHQKLREAATVPVPLERGLDWLGVRLQPRPQRWLGRRSFGYVVPDAKVLEMLARLTEMTEPPSERIDGSAFNAARWIVSINEQLRDWRQAYVYADNALEVFRALDDHSRERVGQLLRSLLGIRPSQLAGRYRVKLPRGFWTWEVPGARLCVLSALAPQAPAFLTRKPVWMRSAPVKSVPAKPAPLKALPVKALPVKAAPEKAVPAILVDRSPVVPALPAPPAKKEVS